MKRIHLARGFRAIAFAISVVLATSCTLLARDVEQCSSDGDCSGAQGRNRCVDNLCVSSSTVPVDGGGDGDAPAVAPGGPCKVSTDCANPDHICSREGECIPITEGPCAQRVPSQERPWRGEKPGPVVALYSVGSQGDSFEKRVVEAAVKQINPVIGAPMTVLLCSKGKKDVEGTARDVVTYLDRRGVPLVYGQFESIELAKLDTKGIAVWSTLGNASGSEVNGSPPPANVTIRYLVDELRHLAPAYQAAVDEAIRRVEVLINPNKVDASTAKIFTVVGSSAESAPLEDAVLAAVTVKGKDGDPPETLKALRASAPDRFRSYRPDAEFDVAVPAPLTTIVGEIKNLKPHVILGIGGDEILSVLDALEPPEAGGRPMWIVSSRTKFNSEGLFQILNSTAQELRQRLIGVDFPGNPAQVTFLDSIDGTSNTNALSYDHLFDATIAVALAYIRADAQRTAANVKTPLSGKELNDALSVLDPSDPDAVTMTGGSSASISATLTAIRAGKRVAYSGTTGQWKFFPTGSRDMTSYPLTYYCYPSKNAPTAPNQLKLYQPETELDGRAVFSKCAAY